MNFDITVGKSRFDTAWKHKMVTWEKILTKLRETHRTAETYQEFMASKPERQDEIKDIGGFVGGLLSGGRRLKSSVVHRQILTLDLDNCTPGLCELIELDGDKGIGLGGITFCIYSTHKHSPEKPRLRLMVPMDRPVMADEYEAIGRWIAGKIGIDQFDNTGFQPERLMYWPSTAKDGQYFFYENEGALLVADSILGMYADWRDISQWPLPAGAAELVARMVTKQGDPLEKPGMVGAFCRTYTMSEAIDRFLGDVYEKCGDRYTYKKGSTAAGLVLYDDKYCFSHHSTDPASGKCCNAFDIVRIHKYGALDEGSPASFDKLPSQEKMAAFASKDRLVKRVLGSEILAQATQVFEVQDGPVAPAVDSDTATDWMTKMDYDKKGHPLATVGNILLVLRNDPLLKGKFGYDQFKRRVVIRGKLPWRNPKTDFDRGFMDSDDAHTRAYFETIYGISSSPKILDGLAIVVKENSFHPVKEYLWGLVWDGVERLGGLFIDFLGAEDNDYIRQVSIKICCGAVARIMQPGCKFDYVLVMVGSQGEKKSQLIEKLGGQWFSDSFGGLHSNSNKAFEQLQGVWLIELGELAGLRRAEVEEIKHFISKRKDDYRPAYGHHMESNPRQCIFFGTTNNDSFLKDRTGNRRFWPVKIDRASAEYDVSDDLPQSLIDQYWAEAVVRYKAGEKLYLDEEMEKQASEVQAEYTEKYRFAETINKYLDKLLPANWDSMMLAERRAFLDEGSDRSLIPEGTETRKFVSAMEIWMECIGAQKKDFSQAASLEIRDHLRSLKNWKESKLRIRSEIYGQQRVFKRDLV